MKIGNDHTFVSLIFFSDYALIHPHPPHPSFPSKEKTMNTQQLTTT